MNQDPIVITAGARTPIGNFQGSLSTLTAPQLGAVAIRAALARSTVKFDQISEVIMGCVLPAGLGQAPARQAALYAGLPDHVPCTTINKMCGSSLKAIMLATDQLIAQPNTEVIIAGGFESMSNAPYLIPKARVGLRLGHGQLIDHMFYDGLEDAYDKGKLMGCFAEDTAKHYGFSRSQQDEFAIDSLDRAKQASEEGWFAEEIIGVPTKTSQGDVLVQQDEGPYKAKRDKIPTLKPAFAKDGTVTAANSSSISDGAAAVVLMRESFAKQHHYPIMAKIVAHASYAHKSAEFTTAPIGAIQRVLKQAQWKIEEVDLFEINEAFAVVTLAAIHDLKLDPAKVNIHGGACALGHPIGASGARILTTLLYALKRYEANRGIATLCIGGGEAVAVAIERIG